MANLRPALLISLVFLAYLLWVEWQKDYGPQVAQGEQTAQPVDSEALSGADIPLPGDVPSTTAGDVPVAQASPDTAAPAEDAPPSDAGAEQSLIRVRTDVLDLAIDPVGGTVVSAELLDYPVRLKQPDTKVRLFSSGNGELYIAQSGLLSRSAAPNHTTPYRADRKSYTLGAGAERLEVPLTWTDPSGVTVTKTYVFHPGRYDIDVAHQVRNGSGSAWQGSVYLQLQRSIMEDEGGAGFNNPERYSFKGIGFYDPEDKLTKTDFEDVGEESYRKDARGGWLSMIQHYFFTAWIPPADQVTAYSSQEFSPNGRPRAIARAVSPQVRVESGAEHSFASQLYVGPKLQDDLDDIAPGLGLTVNYGIFTVLSAPLYWLLSHIHGFTKNWGWAIVLLTVLIKLLFFKLTEAQYRSMARMRKLQPRIEKLKERYGDDRQAMSQAMMKMYKEEKVNPLGGCLPILVQIPIFIALYWVLLESVELRQAPFILWIDNLSVRDPYFVLPLLNAAFMIMTQRLTPMVGMDPLQRKMMQAMPIVFSIMFAFFPAGLVLYWATNAGLSLAQQWYITRKIAGDS